MTACKARGELFIASDDQIYKFADEAGLPGDYVRIQWLAFRERYRESTKRYVDWRAVFRNSVRGNWFRLWWLDPVARSYALTTVGETYRRVLDARAKNSAA